MTPTERAARALHNARMSRQHPKPESFPWEGLAPKQQALLRADVFAVLKAIREPTFDMEAAGSDAGELYMSVGCNGGLAWKAMIDKMLADTGQPTDDAAPSGRSYADGLRDAADLARNWKSPLRPGTDARLLGHQEAARAIADELLDAARAAS